MLRFQIPEQTDGFDTDLIEITLESEEQYAAMDLWLSLDDTYRIIEERPAAHITQRAIGITFSSRDYAWCTGCEVYAIMSVSSHDRYYVSTIARSRKDSLRNGLKTGVLLNPFQQHCYQYYVKRNLATLRVDVEGFSGEADLYVQAQYEPSGPNSPYIMLRATHAPNRAMIFTPEMRQEWNSLTGAYYVCMYGVTDFSGTILVNEFLPADVNNIVLNENQVMT